MLMATKLLQDSIVPFIICDHPTTNSDMTFPETPPLASDDTVKLLWTGGWDSTFLLLWLLLVKGRRVRPFYLIDASRRSTGMELRAMRAIKQRLGEGHPEAAARLLPTQFADPQDLPADPDTRATLDRLRNGGRWHLGSQYAWIVDYCKANRLEGIELPVERDSNPCPTGGVSPLVIPWLTAGDPPLRLRPDAPADLQCLFGQMHFSLTHITKTEMRRQAREQGFEDLMRLTWFCHHPRGRHPCGTCAPCRHAIQEGLGFRIPLAGRLRYRLYLLGKSLRQRFGLENTAKP